MSNRYNNIDELFRDKFERFEPEPPSHVWENIKPHISTGQTGSGAGAGNGLLISLTIILAALGFLSSFLLINDESTIAAKQTPVPNVGLNDNDTAQFVQETRGANLQETPLAMNFTKQVDMVLEDQGNGRKEKNKKKKESKKQLAGSVRIKPDVSSDIPEKNEGRTIIYAAQTPLVMHGDSRLTGSVQLDESNVNKDIGSAAEHIASRHETKALNPLNHGHMRSHDYVKTGEWMVGLYFTPEMIRYPDDGNLNNHSYGIDIFTTWTKNNFLVQSGLGISTVRDKGEYEVNYNKYMGSYEDVYDVTFDTIGNEMIPNFLTETVNMYDSITHVNYTQTRQRFTYLNIPVLFGYTKDVRRFSWFLKTGPSLAIMVNKHIPELTSVDDENKILAVNAAMPDRISTQWNYILSAGITYKAGNRINMSVEPLFRYHITPAYERSSLQTNHPYSFGLRLGFLYNF